MTEKSGYQYGDSSCIDMRAVPTKENIVGRQSNKLDDKVHIKNDGNVLVSTYKDLVTSDIDPSIRK